MAHQWSSVKIWQQTRQKAKVMAAQQGKSFASMIDEAIRALREIRREYGAEWEKKLTEQRADDNFFDEEYS